MKNTIHVLLFLLTLSFCTQTDAQTIYGQVFDQNLNEPLPGATVYLNGTTIGTLSDQDGRFIISTPKVIEASLIISYVGYETMVINKPYRSKKFNVVLQQKQNSLDEVLLVTDTWSREKKLREFRKQFLGPDERGRFCRIINEDDIYLNFQEENATLKASCDVPIRITNTLLGYEITYDLVDFSAKYDNPDRNIPHCRQSYYQGSSFYKDLGQKPSDIKRFSINRENTYKGSVMHFMRALINRNIKAEGFNVYDKGLSKTTTNIYAIERDLKRNNVYHVTFKKDFFLSYNKDQIASYVRILDKNVKFIIFEEGNYLPADNILFDGDLSKTRVGSELPLDYKLSSAKIHKEQ